MNTQPFLGVLAIATISLILVAAAIYYAKFRVDPLNKRHVDNIASGGKSATMTLQEDSGQGDQTAKPLKQRLDESELQRHPDNPEDFGRQPTNARSKRGDPQPKPAPQM